MAKMNENNSNWISKELKSALANAYDRSESEITKEFLSKLSEINLSNRDITSIKGINYAINIKNLNLSKNNIKNVSYLNNLFDLTDLDLSYNKIKKIPFLNNLNKLKRLELHYNNISHLPNLTDLIDLDLINLSNNKVKDLSFIKAPENSKLKIVANDQCILLNNTYVNYGEDYTFKPSVSWDDNTSVLFDNVQIDGSYECLESDKRPSFLFSISKIILKNIKSNCILKAEFYHEANYSKSGILSGILLQPIFIKLAKDPIMIDSIKHACSCSTIYGKLDYHCENSCTTNNQNHNILKNRLITLIDYNGQKFYKFTNELGEYKFENLDSGRYTVLFPFMAGYEYITPSLYFQKVEIGNNIEINSILSKKTNTLD